MTGDQNQMSAPEHSRAGHFSRGDGFSLGVGVDCRSLQRERSGVSTYLEQMLRAMCVVDPNISWTLYKDFPEPLTDQPYRHSNEIHVPLMGVSRRCGGNLVAPIWLDLALPRAMRRTPIDVFWGPAGVLPGRLSVPGVLTIHDLAPIDTPMRSHPFLWRSYFIHVTRRSAKAAAHLVVPSQRIAGSVGDNLRVPCSRVDVIPHGIDIVWASSATAVDRHRLREELGVKGEVFLCVGELSDRKNALTAVKAFALLPSSIRANAHLVLVGGDACEADTIRSVVKSEGLDDRVHLVGYIPPARMPDYYGMASVFLFPSLSESFGFPPLEAMAAGVPVICSNAPNLPQTVGDAAILLPPHDVLGWAEAMGQMLTAPDLRASYLRRGREQVRKYDWAAAAQQMHGILRAAASDRPTARVL